MYVHPDMKNVCKNLKVWGRAWVNLESTNEGVSKVRKNVRNALKV